MITQSVIHHYFLDVNGLSCVDTHHNRGVVKRVNKENKSGNIMDNLLTRMEQYANNLESLVEERTQSYLDEKRRSGFAECLTFNCINLVRCEDLLHELLPKSVANSLIAQRPVTAQSFESCTIYFRDVNR